MLLRVDEQRVLAKRMTRLGTESAFEVLVRARQLEASGKDVIHLEIGEPDFDTPSNIVEAAIGALHEGWTHYGPPAGLIQLREAIAESTKRQLDIAVEPEEVVVTPGGKPIIFFAMLALIERGDEVLYPNPGFPIYESMIRFAGGRPVPYGLCEERDFDIEPEEIIAKITHRTRMVILNSPHNPTGGTISAAALSELAIAIAKSEIVVLSDEIYSSLLYRGSHTSIAQLPEMREHTILLNGFSKTYAMTGWRIGYGIMPANLARQIALLMTNSNSCTASFTQIAAAAALRGDQSSVDRMREEFRQRRDVIVRGLNRIPGFGCCNPRGAFYVFPNITKAGWDCKALADALLNEAGVACLAGTAFGKSGDGYLRFSFANSISNIESALERIGEWVARNTRG